MAKYGGNAQAYGLAHGDVISVGDHKFYCGDSITLHTNGVLDEIFPQKSAVTFSDPPWTPAILKTFNTLADASGVVRDRPFIRFLFDYADMLAHHSAGIIQIWSGLRCWPQLRDALLSCGVVDRESAIGYYGEKTKMKIWVGGVGETTPIPEGLYEADLLRYAASYVRAGTYAFDPCCGQLFTGRALIRAGAIFQGCELIPDKLAKGLKWLEKYSGQSVKIIERNVNV